MKILARYVHGSADSLDCDAVYIVDELPEPRACAAFCNADPSENRNLATVQDGKISRCYKGFPDEVNNALFATYPLHKQKDPLLIRQPVPRDILLKDLSVLRKFLMEMKHTALEKEARTALKRGFTGRMKLAEAIDLNTVPWLIPEAEQLECMKRMAFQFGQALALHEGIEVYTKRAVADFKPELRRYLYRVPCDLQALSAAKGSFMNFLRAYRIEDPGDHTILFTGEEGNLKRRISIRGKEQDV